MLSRAEIAARLVRVADVADQIGDPAAADRADGMLQELVGDEGMAGGGENGPLPVDEERARDAKFHTIYGYNPRGSYLFTTIRGPLTPEAQALIEKEATRLHHKEGFPGNLSLQYDPDGTESALDNEGPIRRSGRLRIADWVLISDRKGEDDRIWSGEGPV
jgi:hypothetical protein